MSSPLIALRALPWRRLARPSRLLATAVLLGGLALGGVLALRLLRPSTPDAILPAQALAWDIARAAAQSAEVQTASGAYLPGSNLILYSRTSHTNQAAVRSWATTELQPFAERLAALPADERLVWVIDYGDAEAAQEVISAPLAEAVDPQQHTYVSAAPGLAGSIATAAITPVAPVLAPSAPPATAPSAAAQPAPQASAAPAPSAAPAASTAPAPAPSVAAAAVPGVATPLLTTDFEGVDADTLKGWNSLSGSWNAHDGIYSQQQSEGFDYISMLDLQPQTDYLLRAKLKLGTGKGGAGFVYNAPNGTTRNGAQNVDFTDGGNFLRWGRYDDNGNYVYGGGVRLDTPVNDGQWHALELRTQGASSVVSVDGKPIGTIANTSPSGYLGLTSSEMQVDFDDIEVLSYGAGPAPVAQPSVPAAPATTSANIADNFDDGDTKGWQVLSGTWQNIEQAYQQTAASGSDFGSISSFTGERYTVSARVKRLSGDMGAGLYFNLAQRDKKAESQMINYTQGGKALQWGHFDEGGNFVFEGSAEVPDGNDGQWHTLTVVVSDGKATFRLDDVEIAKDVALTYTSGYVGLLASNSVVAFDDVAISAQ